MGQQRGKKVMGEGRGKVCQELDLKKKEPNAEAKKKLEAWTNSM